LGFKAPLSQLMRLRDTLASNKEENIVNKEDFVNINNKDNNKDILLVIKDSFFTIIKGLKLKKVKEKEG